VLGSRYGTLAARNHLAFLDQIALGYQGLGGRADMLLERNIEPVGNGMATMGFSLVCSLR